MFFSPNNSESKLLGKAIYSYVTEISPHNKREMKKASKSIYLLWNAQSPAVLLECGFLSNWEDTQLLKSEEYQKKLALCIALGVVDYVNGKELAE
jgi:N-acetylmuramoyl-L-alanine amidase